jgi:hypothetical protein
VGNPCLPDCRDTTAAAGLRAVPIAVDAAASMSAHCGAQPRAPFWFLRRGSSRSAGLSVAITLREGCDECTLVDRGRPGD